LKISVRIDRELTTKCWVGFIGWLGDFVIHSEIETAKLPESWRKFLSL